MHLPHTKIVPLGAAFGLWSARRALRAPTALVKVTPSIECTLLRTMKESIQGKFSTTCNLSNAGQSQVNSQLPDLIAATHLAVISLNFQCAPPLASHQTPIKYMLYHDINFGRLWTSARTCLVGNLHEARTWLGTEQVKACWSQRKQAVIISAALLQEWDPSEGSLLQKDEPARS